MSYVLRPVTNICIDESWSSKRKSRTLPAQSDFVSYLEVTPLDDCLNTAVEAAFLVFECFCKYLASLFSFLSSTIHGNLRFGAAASKRCCRWQLLLASCTFGAAGRYAAVSVEVAARRNTGIMKVFRHLINFGVNPAALAYAMTTLGSSMINNIFSFYYVKLFLNRYKISEGAFHQSQVSILTTTFEFEDEGGRAFIDLF